jgi:uncharacterized protein
MKCVDCGHAMIPINFNNVEVDHCLDCGGVWLGKDELELLFEDHIEARVFMRSFEVYYGKDVPRRKCPVCLRQMKKVLCGNGESIIDECWCEDGLWVEHEELKHILEIQSSNTDNKVIDLLHRTYATVLVGTS